MKAHVVKWKIWKL